MAKSSLGKAVSRVGSSGGGKTYRKNRPANFYAVLIIITVLGLASVIYSRYERQNPATASTVWPTTKDTGFNALASQECGVTLPNLIPERDTTGTYQILKKNVLQIAPSAAKYAGNNATLAAFFNYMPGFSFSTNKMTLGGPGGVPTAATTFVAGTKCAAGTKYAGQAAYPTIAYWTSAAQSKAKVSVNPSAVKIENYMLVTFAFEPKGVVPSQPSAATIAAMFAATASSTTTTTTPPTTTTTVKK